MKSNYKFGFRVCEGHGLMKLYYKEELLYYGIPLSQSIYNLIFDEKRTIEKRNIKLKQLGI